METSRMLWFEQRSLLKKAKTDWNYLGVAVRMALGLGLYRELPEWKISLHQREIRRRGWWGLFIFDTGASVAFGRPVLLPKKRESTTSGLS